MQISISAIQDVTSVYSDDYYVYSKITVSKYDAANEFRRVGMMAWYIDDNNFLYILYSHVGANVSDVGAIGRVGGNTVANDFTNIGGLASLLNTPVEMDVHIVGNSIEIYGGKSPLPIFKYNVPGMAAASKERDIWVRIVGIRLYFWESAWKVNMQIIVGV